jgi:hypothetical protein
MTKRRQHINDLILTSLDFLKSGTNKEHSYLASNLNKLLPTLDAMKSAGFSFQHIITAHNKVVSNWKFDMNDVEELERFIDNYTMNEICFGYPDDFDLPEDFDKHSLTEDLLIVQSV